MDDPVLISQPKYLMLREVKVLTGSITTIFLLHSLITMEDGLGLLIISNRTRINIISIVKLFLLTTIM
jgi:hypothetical protein